MEYFTKGVFGCNQTVGKHQLLNNLKELNLFEKYTNRIGLSNDLQEKSLNKVINYIAHEDCVNQKIGKKGK